MLALVSEVRDAQAVPQPVHAKRWQAGLAIKGAAGCPRERAKRRVTTTSGWCAARAAVESEIPVMRRLVFYRQLRGQHGFGRTRDANVVLGSLV